MTPMAIRDPSCDDDFDHASLTCNEAIERILAAVEVVDGLYRQMLEAEQAAGPKDACDASLGVLGDVLTQKGMSYEELVLAL